MVPRFEVGTPPCSVHGTTVDSSFSRVYEEIHRLVGARLRDEEADCVLRPAVLLDEAYFRLSSLEERPSRERIDFFGTAAQAVRQILVHHARERRSPGRAGDREHLDIEGSIPEDGEGSTDVLELDDALRTLADISRRKARIVELRYFGGLSIDETAAATGLSVATVRSDWALARAWLGNRARSSRLDER